jgi:hypothetical protein
MPVCITGMHRSGTSLVANLLRLCGLYLGAEHDLVPASYDNQGGYWENRKFLSINDDILTELGGTWELPPVVSEGWAESGRFNCLRVRAESLLEEFRDHEPWGWKDPRSSLTLLFWISLGGMAMPFFYGHGRKLKTVICVRNPFEVFYSLRDREYTPNAAGLNLWLMYNQTVLNSTLPQDRIVTHYETYFDDATAELHRVLKFLDIPATEELIESSTSAISDRLRRQKYEEEMFDVTVDPAISKLYDMLCQEANHNEAASIIN